MAIQWGAWRYSGGNGMRVGIDVSRSSVNTNSTSVTYTYKVYTQNQYRYSDNQQLSYGGNSGSGSTSFNNSSSGGSVRRATRTYTYNYPANSYGSSPSTRTFSASLSGAYNGVTPSRSVSNAVPARPYAAPNPVSGVTAARVSDIQATVSWTRNVTNQRPYSSIQILRFTLNGSTWSTASVIATVAGSATSYTDNSTQPNRAYRYSVRPSNSAGTASAVMAPQNVYMTPGAPSGVTAAFSGTGGQVAVKWTRNSHYSDAGISYEVQRKIGSGSYANVVTGLSQTTEQWIDPSPGAGIAQYRVRAVHSGNGSAYAESNTITTVTTPLAPTNLAPDGGAVDPDEVIRFSWKHNHGGDGAAQTAVEWESSLDGGGTWNSSGLQAFTDEFMFLGPFTGLLTPGQTVLWRVRTQGVTSEGVGPWSAPASVPISTRPTITLSAPTVPQGTLPVTAEWIFAQAEGEPQTSWKAELLDGGGNLLESLDGWGAANVAIFSTPLENGEPFKVRVNALSASGMETGWEEIESYIDFIPPSTPLLDATYDPCTGTVVLDLSAEEPEEGVSDTIDYVDIQRRFPDEDWHTIATRLYVNNDLPLFYEESFEDGDGGWSSRNHFSAWNPPATRVSNNAPIPPGYSDESHYLEITWATPNPTASGQNMLVTVTGLEIGQTYTTIMRVYNPSTVGLRSEVYFNGGNVPIPVGPGWQTIRGQFTATAGGRDFGLFTTSPVAGEKVYIDKVRIYVGETPDYPENTIVPTTLVDTIPQTAGMNEYRAISYAPTGAISFSTTEEAMGTNRTGKHFWAFLAYGNGFNQILRMRGDLSISGSATGNRTAQELLRAGFPIALIGKQTGRSISVSGTINYDPDCKTDDLCRYDSSRDEWEQASHDAEIVCYRDHTGRRIFGVLSNNVDTGEVAPGISTVSFGVIETDYSERTGMLEGTNFAEEE